MLRVVASISVGMCVVAAAQEPAVVRPLAYTRVVLPNGLIALLNEDHTSPIVAVQVLYHVGAKDERTGHTGLAHLCEHLMGQGSPNLSQEQKLFVLSLGGSSPAWAITDQDRTQYFYTLPSNQLETALWLESDRMAAPLSTVDDARLKSVREVIRQERLQSHENLVFGDANRFTLDSFFEGQERHVRDPLGPMTDLDAATLADARQFCLPYYVPNNAVLALSGDFKTADAKRMITKYFGSIRRGDVPSHPPVAPTPLVADRRLVIADARARAPGLRLAWFAAGGVSDADRTALNALASALAPSRTGRLSKLLTLDRQLATTVTAANIDLETGSVFQIEITPRGDASLTLLETLVDSVVADLTVHPITEAELAPFKHTTPVQAIVSLQTRAQRADTLAQSEAFTHDPVVYVAQAEQAARLTPAEVAAVAHRYLTKPHVVMSLVPAGKLDAISKPSLPYTNVTPVKPQ